MKFLKTKEELVEFLAQLGEKPGCLADTGFLYVLSYVDDRIYKEAIEISDILSEAEIPIFANVISRMEFIDLIFRKQITMGAIQVFEELNYTQKNKDLYNQLKNIRDQNSSNMKKGRSFNIGERKLKDLRKLLNDTTPDGWMKFCNQYAGEKLFNEWQMLEEELGLNFIEIMEGEASEHFNEPLKWSDMVSIMAKNGLTGTDAMIYNLFDKSKFPLLITSDGDFKDSILDDFIDDSTKAIFTI